MSRRRRALWQLALGLGALAALGLLLWRGQEQQRAAQRQTLERRMVFVSLVKNDITRVELARGDVRVRLERLPGGDPPRWQMKAPVDAPADLLSTEALLSTLSLMDFLREVEPSAETDAALYGLAPPRAEVRVSAGDGPGFGLRVGKTNPFDRTLYVQRIEDRAILLVAGHHEDALLKTADQLRDKNLWPEGDRGIRRLVLRPAGQPPLALERNAAGRWTQRPTDAPVNPEEVERLIDVLRSLHALSFPPPGVVPLFAYGLSPPRFTLEVGLEGSAPPITLAVGQGTVRSNLDRTFFRRLSPDGPVAQIPEELGALLQSLPTRLRTEPAGKP